MSMSTRCNVLLKTYDGDVRIYFYRHFDGCLSVAGQGLVDIVRSHEPAMYGVPWIGDIAQSMATEKDETGRHQWQLTAGAHGDIERFYILTFEGFLGHGKDRPLLFQWASGYGPELQQACSMGARLSLDDFHTICREGIDFDSED